MRYEHGGQHDRQQNAPAVKTNPILRFGNELGLIMIDLDNFKKINDSMGHAAGDELLKRVTERIKLNKNLLGSFSCSIISIIIGLGIGDRFKPFSPIQSQLAGSEGDIKRNSPGAM